MAETVLTKSFDISATAGVNGRGAGGGGGGQVISPPGGLMSGAGGGGVITFNIKCPQQSLATQEDHLLIPTANTGDTNNYAIITADPATPRVVRSL